MADSLTTTQVASQSDPVIGAVAITGSDQTFTVHVRGVYVATAGNLECTFANGSAVTLIGLLAGVVYPFAITEIRDAGTTCTGHVLV